MKPKAWAFCSMVVLILCSGAVFSYDPSTHEKLSTAAVDTSQMKKDPEVLKNFGLKATDKFKNTEGKDREIAELIQDGANFEDNASRPLNHFYNPLTGKGLAIGYASPDWALEDKRDVDGQEFSYKWARQYFYDALTKTIQAERDKNFGKTFQTLGQVIHHIQDMAQPQHVRDDLHCDAVIPCKYPGALLGLDHPSAYEKWTKDHPETVQPYYSDANYNPNHPVVFTSARAFWTGNGQGLADFTNANFLSAGTNFESGTNGQPVKNSRYDLPEWNGTLESVTFWDLLKKEGIDCTAATGTPASTPRSLTVAIIIVPPPPTVPDLPPACQLNGQMVFYGTDVFDAYAGKSAINKRASTLSSFDQDLEKNNLPLTFSLNRFNFQYAYPHLIPKAVGYSAGLIDYFFRGKLEAGDAAFSDTGVALRVRNAIARSDA